ncbi:predicted signal transduction protein containing a membrane domain, an EAL and a GGDEF domain [Nitrococcus mobilis Nb-231]|uniref:Predicted signal transduction protein containing a membrane domain, an EAL and a GGDEF domain n=1 Tax=Nitrococcus mobilis Nb-231 TaxID=314278 RepID=A4BUI0_9GAMM|nr:predicted signal transduction protein containing a membrane domain, an EAL and a GGDEF domain [Nitrococcus mobilis Nb-231]
MVLLLKLGSGWWSLIVAGELFTGWSLSQPLTMRLAGGMAQTLEASLGVWLLRWAGRVECFRNLSQTIHFSIAVRLIPPLLSAGVGTLAQFVHGLVPLADWRAAWFTWWLGDALGLLIVAPVLMVWWRWLFRDAHTVLAYRFTRDEYTFCLSVSIGIDYAQGFYIHKPEPLLSAVGASAKYHGA